MLMVSASDSFVGQNWSTSKSPMTFSKPLAIESPTESCELVLNRFGRAKGDRGDGQRWIGCSRGWKHSAPDDEEVFDVVGTALGIDDRVLGIRSHPAGPHDVPRAGVEVRIRLEIPHLFGRAERGEE